MPMEYTTEEVEGTEGPVLRYSATANDGTQYYALCTQTANAEFNERNKRSALRNLVGGILEHEFPGVQRRLPLKQAMREELTDEEQRCAARAQELAVE